MNVFHSGIRLDRPFSQIEMKLFSSKLKFDARLEVEALASLMSIEVEGTLNANISKM